MKNKDIIQLRPIAEKAITDIDTASRKVSGYFAAFDNIDSHGDVIRRGAFAKSIQERGVNASGNRRIVHLWQHQTEHPIGKIIELEEDHFGLRFVSELIDTQKANDALVMYQEGVIREHSIGFSYLTDKMTFVEGKSDDESFWEIKEVKLYEGSSVTFGSNENTPFIGMKDMTDEDRLEELNRKLSDNVKILKSGQGSDDLLEAAEYNIKLIQKAFNDLLFTQSVEAVKDTLKNEPKKAIETTHFFKHLLNKSLKS